MIHSRSWFVAKKCKHSITAVWVVVHCKWQLVADCNGNVEEVLNKPKFVDEIIYQKLAIHNMFTSTSALNFHHRRWPILLWNIEGYSCLAPWLGCSSVSWFVGWRTIWFRNHVIHLLTNHLLLAAFPSSLILTPPQLQASLVSINRTYHQHEPSTLITLTMDMNHINHEH